MFLPETIANPDRWFRRRVLFGVAVILVALLSSACGGGSSGGTPALAIFPTTPSASFTPSGTAPAPDRTYLSAATFGDIVTLQLVTTGPTASSDLYSYALDLVLGDPTVAQYIPGSASFGSALTLAGAQQGQALANQAGNRITIGVTKVGGGSGNGLGTGEQSVVSLAFRVLKPGSTTIVIAGSPPNAAAALDSAGAAVPTMQFDSAAATISGI